MPALGLGFQGEVVEEEARRKEGRQLRSGGRRRRRRGDDGSPDTLIYYSSDHHSCSGDGAFGDAGGSLFSSGARSAGNPCSFGSDHEAVFSILVLSLTWLSHPSLSEAYIFRPISRIVLEKEMWWGLMTLLFLQFLRFVLETKKWELSGKKSKASVNNFIFLQQI